MKRALILAAAALSGCGVDCDIENREGTYLVTYDPVGGTCGDLPDAVVTLGSTGSASCTVVSSDVSDDMCTLNSEVVCEDQGNNARTRGTGSVTEADGGETATGTFTMDIRTLDTNTTICQGTYDVTYTRQ